MKTIIYILTLFFFVSCQTEEDTYESIENLRILYSSGDVSLWPKPNLHPSVQNNPDFEDIGVMSDPPENLNNVYTKEKYELGKALFFEPQLSQSNTISCGSCHQPNKGWTDHEERSLGHDNQKGKRNAMTILNSAFADKLFWDGRAISLEHQAMFPIADPVEMNEKLPTAIKKIKDIPEYKTLFSRAFKDEQINMQNLQKAIAVFERTIISPKTKFDKFISGESEIYSDSELRGLHLFRTKAQCINCHNTPYFSDNKFHNDGLTHLGTKHEDLGLYYVTKIKADKGKFKTPTLREISKTGPWMHTGFFKDLEGVIDYYNLGNPMPVGKTFFENDTNRKVPGKSDILTKLNLSEQEKADLLNFLETLSSEGVILE